jgi:enoyl-CoA hydratase
MTDLVLREDRDGLTTLTLNRPEKLNALNGDVFGALERHLKTLAREKKTVGLVVLRGAGGHFSSGYDMAEVELMLRAHAKPHYQSEVIERLADLPQPVVTAVEGQCSTGALELALAGDLIVAAESARFSDVYARWGLTPLWGMNLRLPLRVGAAKAREMIYTCHTYSGREAEHSHLANFCFPDDRFEVELEALCRDILQNSWYANRVNKHTLIETDGLTLDEARALEMFKNEGVAPDAAERVASFLNRPRNQD